MVKSSKKETTNNKFDVFLGNPNCPKCKGLGYIRKELPPSHPEFGKIIICSCRNKEIQDNIQSKLFSFSNLGLLSHYTFDNFKPEGKEGLPPNQAESIKYAYTLAKDYANQLEGWIFIEGTYGCGKTHLAAAIGNHATKQMDFETLFITTPDLLDALRFAYSDPEETFENRFNTMKSVPLLILDDFGTQNATNWADEKLFQILNYRYINHLPTVITTNLPLDNLEGRIRSRLQDEKLVTNIKITAPDYRLPPNETSLRGLSSLHLHPLATFGNFNARESDEGIGVEEKTIIFEDKNGKDVPVKKTIINYITKEDIRTLFDATEAAITFAEKPKGWLILIGPHGSGKTHLAAAIGNYRVQVKGQPAILVDVIELFDYLRETFSNKVDVVYSQRFNEIRKSPLLILDGVGTENPTDWAKEKLFQLLDFRYNSKLPTVITTALSLEEIEEIDDRIVVRLLDESFCTIKIIDMPKYYGIEIKRPAKRRD